MKLLVKEIFTSIQGEGEHVGLPFHFIRLSGCNLRCVYCDTSYAFKGGELMSFDQIMDQIPHSTTKNALLTGGEPLMQPHAKEFLKVLCEANYNVCIETHGEAKLEAVPQSVHVIMDIKTPGSKMCREGFFENFQYLKPTDELKFVITSKEDYKWSKEIIRSKTLPTSKILFSPALNAEEMPGEFEAIQPKNLAQWILDDHLPVRFQLQLHKQLWGDEKAR